MYIRIHTHTFVTKLIHMYAWHDSFTCLTHSTNSANRFEMIHEPLSLEEGTLIKAGLSLPCPWQKGGGETSGIGREALRVVDYVDLSV